MSIFVGMDLHSNNTVVVGIDQEKKVILRKKFKNDLSNLLSTFESVKPEIKGIAVESTYNWYWLVDGLIDAGYKVHLAHPGEIDGPKKKHTDDFDDAYNLADLLRKDELPQGYIYPKEDRALRDLLRKRSVLVKKRTDCILSLINLYSRNTGKQISGTTISGYRNSHLKEVFEDEAIFESAHCLIDCIRFFKQKITQLEKSITKKIKTRQEYSQISSIAGFGPILTLTIVLETGEISRFRNDGNYVSYCRGVGSKRISNGKKKGENNRKSGNKYLAWAFVEAAHFAKIHCPYAKAFYERKLKQTRKSVIAIKALASKLARASYFIMRDNVPYDKSKIFPQFKSATIKGCGSKPA